MKTKVKHSVITTMKIEELNLTISISQKGIRVNAKNPNNKRQRGTLNMSVELMHKELTEMFTDVKKCRDLILRDIIKLDKKELDGFPVQYSTKEVKDVVNKRFDDLK